MLLVVDILVSYLLFVLDSGESVVWKVDELGLS